MEWFEEGVTIYFSMKIFYNLTKDLDTLQNYRLRSYLYSKVKPVWDFRKQYFEYSKIISLLFMSGGEDVIFDLINHYLQGNRNYINNSLNNISNISVKYLPKNDFENFIFTFPTIVEPELITPLEYLIVENLSKQPLLLDNLAKAVQAPVNITTNSLNQLYAKGICLMVKDNKIDINWKKLDLFKQGLMKAILPLKQD